MRYIFLHACTILFVFVLLLLWFISCWLRRKFCCCCFCEFRMQAFTHSDNVRIIYFFLLGSFSLHLYAIVLSVFIMHGNWTVCNYTHTNWVNAQNTLTMTHHTIQPHTLRGKFEKQKRASPSCTNGNIYLKHKHGLNSQMVVLFIN